MLFRFRFLYTFFFISVSVVSNAQLSSVSADCTDKTVYKIHNIQDSIFIFNIDNAEPSIQAVSPGGDSAKFEWSYFNSSLGYIDFRTDSGISSTIDTLTASLGYRVIITEKLQLPDTFRCWVLMNNDFDVAFTSTDNDTIPIGFIYCHLIDQMQARIDSVQLYYYHPENKNLLKYRMSYTVDWTSNFPDNATDPAKYPGNPLNATVRDPYWKDTWYIINVTDKGGLLRSDSVFYKSIRPKAEFTNPPKYIELGDTFYYPDMSKKIRDIYFNSPNYSYKSAPAIYMFDNLSENTESFTWFFGDSLTKDTTANADTILHTYYQPGTYYAKLVAKREFTDRGLTCTDTFPKPGEEMPIEVEVWSIGGETIFENFKTNIPNVIVPPDYFRIENDVSLSYIEIAIYNRYGKRLHYYKGNIRDWEGWDCTFKNDAVPAGVYYYVVKRLDPIPNFDESINTKKVPDTFRDFFHVFNDN